MNRESTYNQKIKSWRDNNFFAAGVTGGYHTYSNRMINGLKTLILTETGKMRIWK